MLDLLENPEFLRSPNLRLEELAIRGVPYGCAAREFPVELVSQVTLAPIVASSTWSHELGETYQDAAGRNLSLSEVVSNALQLGGILHFPESVSFKFENGHVTGLALYGASLNFFAHIGSHAQFVKEFGVADVVQTKEAYGDLMGYEHYYRQCQKFVEWDEMRRKIVVINFGIRRHDLGVVQPFHREDSPRRAESSRSCQTLERRGGTVAFPATEIHLEAAERELGVKLPPEFRERLLARNGGELSTAGDDWQVFPVFDATNRKTAGRSAGHIVLENRNARSWEGFPKSAVAIAANGSGDLLLFLPEGASGRLDPQVFVWDHETRKCTRVALRYGK